MKNVTAFLSAIVLFVSVAAPVRAGTTNDGEFAGKFAMKLVEIVNDCQKVRPGMTRAELTALQTFDEDWGPLRPANPKYFRQHARFQYRGCSLIEIDVDFQASGSTDEQPSDVITKVSMPYIDARRRR
jgi:hypothetical protein